MYLLVFGFLLAIPSLCLGAEKKVESIYDIPLFTVRIMRELLDQQPTTLDISGKASKLQEYKVLTTNKIDCDLVFEMVTNRTPESVLNHDDNRLFFCPKMFSFFCPFGNSAIYFTDENAYEQIIDRLSEEWIFCRKQNWTAMDNNSGQLEKCICLKKTSRITPTTPRTKDLLQAIANKLQFRIQAIQRENELLCVIPEKDYDEAVFKLGLKVTKPVDSKEQEKLLQ